MRYIASWYVIHFNGTPNFDEYIDFTKSHVNKNLRFGLAPVP